MVPVWLDGVGDGCSSRSFDPNASPVICYVIMQSRLGLIYDLPGFDYEDLYSGGLGCWPCRGNDVGVILSFMRDVVHEMQLQLLPGVAYNVASFDDCYQAISLVVHPDRMSPNYDARVRYAASACFSLVGRCRAVILGADTIPDVRPMPRMLITPFLPDCLVDRNPPSRFEYASACYAKMHYPCGRNPYVEYWEQIRQSYADMSSGVEENFWLSHDVNSFRLEVGQVFYGVFIRCPQLFSQGGWKIRLVLPVVRDNSHYNNGDYYLLPHNREHPEESNVGDEGSSENEPNMDDVLFEMQREEMFEAWRDELYWDYE